VTVPTSPPGGPPARELVGELLARAQWTPERLAAHQRERLDGLLRHAVANSPYYRRVLGADAAHGGVPLRELPTLTKSALMEHFDEIVTDGRVRRGAAAAHLAGAEPGRLLAGHRVFSTAGSTGERGIVVSSPAEFTVWTAAHLRMMATMGATPGMRAVAIGSPSPGHLSRQMFAETGGPPGDAPELDVTTPMPELVARLNAYRPDAISTYASIAALLAEEQLSGRLAIAPAMVAAGAEILTEDMRRRVRDAWGVEPHQAYLATEAPLLASTSAAQVGMHLWEDLVLVEVVDAAGRPVAPGVPGHKVLITNLVNRVQPLIRYELSDSVTLAPGPDPTGRPFRRLSDVDGRSYEIITLPAAGGATVSVHPAHLRSPFTAFPEVVQYQLTYDDGGLTGRVVLRPGAPSGIPDRLRAALTRRLRYAGAIPPPITITAVAGLARDTGHAAKFHQFSRPGHLPPPDEGPA
jgi:phenylacetate-coenzyme A ligase PaaK-like adenylate-forming protein